MGTDHKKDLVEVLLKIVESEGHRGALDILMEMYNKIEILGINQIMHGAESE